MVGPAVEQVQGNALELREPCLLHDLPPPSLVVLVEAADDEHAEAEVGQPEEGVRGGERQHAVWKGGGAGELGRRERGRGGGEDEKEERK
eukprot:303066-Hanusia_phi.AAC.1